MQTLYEFKILPGMRQIHCGGLKMISIADLAALILVILLILCGVSFVFVLMIKGEDSNGLPRKIFRCLQ